MDNDFDYIDTQEKQAIAYEELKEKKILGIDLECENNLHHYGAYISLIQISSRNKNYIIDVIRLENIDPIVKLIESPEIQKIFHDVSFDFRILNHQFSCKPKNVFDSQFAAELVGHTQLGLAAILEEYYNAKKNTKFQMADWTKRPIAHDMLQYAVGDTAYLIPLKELLEKKLIENGKIEWAEQTFERYSKQVWPYKDISYLDVKNLKKFTDEQISIVKTMFAIRNKYAKRVDRPIHYIISTKKIVEVAQNPPKTIDDWKRMKGTHSILRKKAYDVFYSVKHAKSVKVELPKKDIKKFSDKDKLRIDKVTQLRNKIATKMGISNHILMNKDQIHQVVITQSLKPLLKWQHDVVEDEFKKKIKFE